MGIATQYEGGLKFSGDQMYITTSSGTTLLTLGNTGNATFAGTIGATNFSGSSSGTNTGDQVLPTLSSLGALSTSGGTLTGQLNMTADIIPSADSTYDIGSNTNKFAEGHFDHLYIGETANNPRIDIYTENGTASIADTFADTSTDKSYIYFQAGTGSNDPGYIMHETSESASPDERNEGVLHLVPSDDNNDADYVSIHGTNDPDALRLSTTGKITTSSSYQLTLSSGSGIVRIDDGLEVIEYISHVGDSDTYVRFEDNRIRIAAAGTVKFDTNNTYLTSETFSSSDVALSLGGNDIIAGTSITLAGGLSYNDSTSTLSQTDNNTTYSAGTLLDLSSTTFNVDLSELTNNTASFAPTQDHFVILDNGVQGKKLASSIFGSAAYEASSSFATASHAHGGVYVPEYEALQPSGSDKEMNVWRKTHAVYSDNGGISTYIVIQTEVPQDNVSMGGFTLVYQDEYNSGGEGGEIKIYGYWNPESNGGFVGFRYECSNPYHTPTIEVCRNSASGNTAFFISGEGGNYTQLIAKDLWLGYSANSATQQWGNGWVISEASAKTGYTGFDTLNRNDFAAITTNGSTPSLTGGVSAAEVRTLIGAGTSSSDTTYSAGTGLTLTNTTFSVTANTYAAASHNHDDRYYTETQSDARYPRGVTKSYNSVDTDSNVDAWYKIFQTTDSGSTPVECHVRGYAHSSISFIVSEGYLGSGGHVQVLDYCLSTNNNYKWIKGVRIISNGDVELLLQGGSTVSLEMTVIGDAVVVNQPELSSAASNTVKDTVVNPTTGMLRAKGVISGSNTSNWDTAYTHSQAAHAPSNAEQNVQSDWNETGTTSDAFIKNKPTLGTAAATASTDYISATSADAAAELITFNKGISSDGNSKFYNWRALNNSSNSGNSYWKIADISGADQSSRFIVTIAGRSTSYSNASLPAMGHIVGQLNNDNNWDLVFYNHSTASSEVVTEVGIVDDGVLGVELWIKTGNYAEITASGHISDGSFTVNSNASSDGFTTSPDGYTVVTEYTSYNSGNLTAGTNVSISSSGVISSTDTNTVYTHPTSAGNKHIPTGGAAGQFLKYSSSGTAVWATPSYTTNTNTQLSNEQVQDIVGAMFSNNTESNITATYQDGDGTIDLAVAANYGSWDLVAEDDTTFRVDSTEHVKFQGASISGTGTQSDPFLVNTADTNTTYTADGNYGMTLSGTAFRLENDRRRNSTTQDIYTGNTHDYTFYDASVGIRWYTAGAEEMRLEDDGDLHVDGDVIAFSTTVSDERLKDNVETIDNAIHKVKQLRGVEYTWNEGSRKGQREIGVIAQEVEKVVPEIVHEKKLPFVGDETYKTVDYEKLVALLIESNKELVARVETLEAKLDGTTK